MSSIPRYVLCSAITPDGSTAVGLTKLKGPAHLVRKLSFPGGRIEDGEDREVAAARELEEETGLAFYPSDFCLLKAEISSERELYFYGVVSNRARHARTVEEEPIWLLDTAFHTKQAGRQPDAYASDFLDNLSLLQALSEDARTAA